MDRWLHGLTVKSRSPVYCIVGVILDILKGYTLADGSFFRASTVGGIFSGV